MEDGQGPAAAVVVEPQPAASTPAIPEGHGTYDMGTHITVPTADIDARYEGRWSGVMGDAHKYQQGHDQGLFEPGVAEFAKLAKDNNITSQQMYDYITTVEQPPQPTPPAQPGHLQPTPAPGAPPPDPSQQPLTLADFNKIRDEDANQAAISETNRQLGEEFKDVADTLRGFKFNIADDGRPGDSIAEVAEGVFNKALNRIMREDVPDWLTGDERKKRLDDLSKIPSTSSQRQRAKAIFEGQWRDLANDNVARFAKGQESVPGGSLEGGAGGPPQPQQGQLTYEQEVDQLKAAMMQSQQGLPR